jgi:hypothetical protein
VVAGRLEDRVQRDDVRGARGTSELPTSESRIHDGPQIHPNEEGSLARAEELGRERPKKRR